MDYTPKDYGRWRDGADSPFPTSPIPESERIRPLNSWARVHYEVRATGIEFDAFWYEAIRDGVCYLFRWAGERPAIVLVVLEDDGITWIETRTQKPGNDDEAISEIEAVVLLAFRESGIEFRRPAILH